MRGKVPLVIKVNKIDAAVHQLDWAIRLLIDHKEYIPAITLAGAADEILGQVVGPQESAFGKLTQKFIEVHKIKKDIITQKHLNMARNWLKHYDHSHPMEIEIELDSEAAQYIIRGVSNLFAYDRSVPSEFLRFMAWLNKERPDFFSHSEYLRV